MIDLVQCVQRLRPGCAWKKDMVNGYSLETIGKTYLSADPLPTLAECEAVWPTIDAENLAVKNSHVAIREAQASAGLRGITLEQAYTYIDNQLDGASTAAETKEAIRRILKKMIPYILQ